MEFATILTFIVYLVGMLVIGLLAYQLTTNLSDYVLGGRKLGGSVAALSAGASDMSSWLLLGLPGAMYVAGMSEIWLAIGLSIGAYLNWQFVAGRLRKYTEVAGDSITLPDFFENRFRDQSKILRVISALVILVFFAFYTSSGLVAGALLFEASFGLGYTQALWIGAAVIISYTFLGGFLAVSWTDFFQGILMFLALLVVPVVAISEMGGWDQTVNAVGQVDPMYLDAFAGTTILGIVSLLAWGLGYFGQPHILTRFMAVKSAKEIPKARFIGMTWMVLSLFGAIFTGFIGIAYFAGQGMPLGQGNEETVFIAFTQVLFNPWVAGFLLAAILSAIMSTIDSQLLVSSSALAEDFYKGIIKKEATQRELVWVGRLGVVVIALIAIMLAYNPDNTVLGLVGYAWAGFGAAFGPVILLSLFWRRMTRNGALAGMLVGGITVVVWDILSTPPVDAAGNQLPQSEAFIPFSLYEIIPGFLLATLAIVIVSLIDKQPAKEIQDEFSSIQ
ncbi:sodium/proline symporter PutP [Desertibacillus haloalkaliphilus]|uniref:sodium/proline symporter PutP n=1 Tax=Desertibacillus haloalkaliphilus TaxID=1328930 RepID=UPI001C267EE5|nr:sodium/proline symporter PutP [Desertibacillus haloalkaliphilus]MBU8906404.1 sodium/proline symporter PutP [Desertibacillus haloalkaliphilus]